MELSKQLCFRSCVYLLCMSLSNFSPSRASNVKPTARSLRSSMYTYPRFTVAIYHTSASLMQTLCIWWGGVRSLYDGYDTDTLERVWHSLLKRHNQVLKALGGNDLEVGHTGTKKMQRQGELGELVHIDRDAYNNVLSRRRYVPPRPPKQNGARCKRLKPTKIGCRYTCFTPVGAHLEYLEIQYSATITEAPS